MDCQKVGRLIFDMRTEKNMTQKQVADALNISDKTVSKWERGLGCPDVSLLSELSGVLGINIEKILMGDLEPNDTEAGNMKRIKFYVCPNCGNVLNTTGEAEVSCCGRKLLPLQAAGTDEAHKVLAEDVDNEYYITLNHEMSKAHFISFAAYVTSDKLFMVKLYPEQSAAFRMPRMRGGKLYYYCTEHGFFVSKL